MNPHDDNGSADAGLQALYRQTGADRQPPAQLDRDILQAAARATHIKAGKRGFWQRLQMPVSVSAALVVTIMLARWMPAVTQPDLQLPAPATPISDQAQALDSRAQPAAADSGIRELEEAGTDRLQERSLEDNAAVARRKAAAMEKLASPAIRAAKGHMPSQPPAREQGAAESRTGGPAGQTQTKATLQLPADWLAEIRQLATAGQSERAARELRAFVAAYPHYPVEPPLKALLETPPDH